VTNTATLYAELKPDLEALATPLFNFSKECLRARGNFVPHAQALTSDGEIVLVGASDGKDVTTADAILPILHDALREVAAKRALAAIGVSENVMITLPGDSSTSAIKVLFEHRRGLTVALYMPFDKKLFRGYVFGETFSILAKPEVNAW